MSVSHQHTDGFSARLTALAASVTARLGQDEHTRASSMAALTVLFIRCAAALLAYASQVVLARYLGTSGYGVYALVWAWIIVLGHLTPLGLSQTVCRYAPHYAARGEEDLLRGFLFASLKVIGGLSAFATLMGSIILWGAQDLLENVYVLPFAIALLVVPFFALQDYLENIARAFNWPVLAILPISITRHGFIALGIIGLALSGMTITAPLAVAVTFGAIFVSFLLQAILIWKRLRKLIPAGPQRADTRTWVRTALPFFFVDGTIVLASNADILVLSLFVEPAEVGIYFAVSRILQLVSFVEYAATAATAQRFSALHAIGDRPGLENLVRHTTQLTFVAASGAAFIIYLAAPFLLSLFGDGFSDALPVLAILLVGLLAHAAAGPGEDLLSMLGEERACAWTFFASLIVNVALAVALIPAFGIMGAATATALTMALRGFGLTFVVRRRLGLNIWFSLRRAARPEGSPS